MIILDTNIISELMKSAPDEKVISWIDRQNAIDIYITSISMAEIYYGLGVLPSGKRRAALMQAFNEVVDQLFGPRVLVFDEDASSHYGAIMASRKKAGKPMSILDGQIAAIASAANAGLATRNTKDFAYSDLNLVNPFSC